MKLYLISPRCPISHWKLSGKTVKKNGVSEMIFIRECLIAKRLYAYKDSLKCTMSKNKWCVTFAYIQWYNNNKDRIFKEINKSLINITRKYENVQVVGDLNIDILEQKKCSKNLLISPMWYVLALKSYIGSSCVKSSVGSSIDVMLTNRPRSFTILALLKQVWVNVINWYCHSLALILNECLQKL